MVFIAIEGIDKAGKTTVANQLVDTLRNLGLKTGYVREPGGTHLGEELRDILLGHREVGGPLAFETELFLFLASRAQLVKETIHPYLVDGTHIIADRWTYSTLAYQSYGWGFDRDLVRKMNSLSTGEIVPDLVLFLDLPVEIARERYGTGVDRDRFEKLDTTFYERVRQGFLAEASIRHPLGPQRRVVDATRDLSLVFIDCLSTVMSTITSKGPS